MNGDPMLFSTKEAVEAQWQIVDGILGDVTPRYEYVAARRGAAR